MSISKTLSQLSAGGGRPLSDQDLLKWANTTVQKAKPTARTIRSFKDPSLTTGLFVLDLLDAIRPGIVDPSLVVAVGETGDYEERRQNGTPIIFFLFGRTIDDGYNRLLSLF
jgi:plastin-1